MKVKKQHLNKTYTVVASATGGWDAVTLPAVVEAQSYLIQVHDGTGANFDPDIDGTGFLFSHDSDGSDGFIIAGTYGYSPPGEVIAAGTIGYVKTTAGKVVTANVVYEG